MSSDPPSAPAAHASPQADNAVVGPAAETGEANDRWHELSDTERRMAVVVLALIGSWTRWVHRRVEGITFDSPGVFARKISVDFTIPSAIAPPLPALGTTNPEDAGTAQGTPLYSVPLGLLLKDRLRDFDLRDEGGRALPLLTASKNAAVAAGVLREAAEVFVAPQVDKAYRDSIPQDVLDDLWAITHQPLDEAEAIWNSLGQTRSGGDGETGWRKALVLSGQFMALARDLAINFLVLVPLATYAGQRRVLKFSYLSPVGPAIARGRGRRSTEPGGPLTLGPAGAGLVRIKIVCDPDDQESEPEAHPGVGITIRTVDGRRVEQGESNDEGELLREMPVGRYTARVEIPRGFIEMIRPVQPFEVTVGDEVVLEFRHRRLKDVPLRESDDRAAASSRWKRTLTAFGLRSERIVVLTPAIGQAASYHIELEAPDGMQITTARLDRKPASGGGPETEVEKRRWRRNRRRQLPAAPPIDIETISVQRAHLYAGGTRQDVAGSVVAHLRSRAETLVRTAVLVATISAVLLAAVGLKLGALRGNPGPGATVLLLIPGGLSAWVVRPREATVTTRILFGLRVLAATVALWPAIGAVALILSLQWTTAGSGAAVATGLWSHLGFLFAVLFALSVATLLLLAAVWRRCEHPPEQLNWRQLIRARRYGGSPGNGVRESQASLDSDEQEAST